MSHQPRPKLDLRDISLGKLYIGGHWIEPIGGSTIEVVSPDNEEILVRVAEATNADVDVAVAAAREAFDRSSWPRQSPIERAEWVRKLSDALKGWTEELALCWSLQIGALYRMSKASIPFFVKTMDQYVDIARTMEFVERRPTGGTGVGLVAYEPVGVVAAIAPWNVPLNTMLHKIGPALIGGCTVIMKPAPETPLEAYIVARCADEIGLPAGVLNMLTARRDASDYLVRSAGVDKVAFTGSVTVGKRIASVCGERIARYTLELGGKSAAIILDDFDLDEVAKKLVDGMCALSGQNCALLSRAFISRQRHDALVSKMVALAERKVVGRPFDESTELGPIAMERQLERIEEIIAAAVAEGATLATGGKRPANLERGYFIEPTVFANVRNDMRVAREEIFGPVVCVIPYDTLDHAIEMANDSDFGLSGAVFTNDDALAYQVARRVRTGTMGQNGARNDFSIGFGGFKKSGIGREGGIAGLKSYLEPKTLLLNSLPERL